MFLLCYSAKILFNTYESLCQGKITGPNSMHGIIEPENAARIEEANSTSEWSFNDPFEHHICVYVLDLNQIIQFIINVVAVVF